MTYPIASERRTALESEVIDLARELSPDELRVLRYIGRRMIRIGHGKYGPLDLSKERRNWSKERAQEKADDVFYDSCEAIAEEDARIDRVETFISAAVDGEFGDDEPTAERVLAERFDVSDEGAA